VCFLWVSCIRIGFAGCLAAGAEVFKHAFFAAHVGIEDGFGIFFSQARFEYNLQYVLNMIGLEIVTGIIRVTATIHFCLFYAIYLFVI